MKQVFSIFKPTNPRSPIQLGNALARETVFPEIKIAADIYPECPIVRDSRPTNRTGRSSELALQLAGQKDKSKSQNQTDRAKPCYDGQSPETDISKQRPRGIDISGKKNTITPSGKAAFDYYREQESSR